MSGTTWPGRRWHRQVWRLVACSDVEGDVRYEFIIKGSVGPSVASVLPQMRWCTYPTGGTSLFGPVQDEADVLTVFQALAALGLTVVEFRRLPD